MACPDFYASAAKDHAHGIRVIEHFTANQCFEAPDVVMRNFLELLKKS